MRRGATFDASMRYRYTLWRAWNGDWPRITFVMLNPSTADDREDDPTIRRCIDFARRWSYGSLLVVNLFAFRTHDPRHLLSADDPIGPKNDRYLAYARRRASATVVAWGAHGGFMGRHDEVVRRLGKGRTPLLCLGCTKYGFPRHPLYLPNAIRPVPWAGAAATTLAVGVTSIG